MGKRPREDKATAHVTAHVTASEDADVFGALLCGERLELDDEGSEGEEQGHTTRPDKEEEEEEEEGEETQALLAEASRSDTHTHTPDTRQRPACTCHPPSTCEASTLLA